MGIIRKTTMLAGAVASLVAVGAAGAQTVAYTTSGYFSGPGTGPGGAVCSPTTELLAAATATCSYSNFTLTFTNATHDNVGSGSTINLGNFFLASTGEGTVTAPPGELFFHLLITQSQPQPGMNSFVGDISGTVTASTTDGNTSSLIWTPTPTSQPIPPSIYTLIFDNSGPAAGVGYAIPINDTKAITAQVVTTPEPSSMALLGTGLVGLVPMIRRRRK